MFLIIDDAAINYINAVAQVTIWLSKPEMGHF